MPGLFIELTPTCGYSNCSGRRALSDGGDGSVKFARVADLRGEINSRGGGGRHVPSVLAELLVFWGGRVHKSPLNLNTCTI